MNGDDRRAGPSVGAPSIEVVSSLAEVSPDAWDRVAGDDDPFVEHAFLRALETSGSVGADSGWAPCHIIARGAGGRLVGAMPLYLKDNSYGEYIFDWSWADASHRARIPYYPKLVSAVPFTPATGRRLLVADDAGPEVSRALLAGARDLADALGASSIHVLFCTEAERLAASEWMGWLPRTTYQFHWTNAGYGSFDDFLGRFRAQSRRQVRSERRRAREGGLRLNLCRGTEMTDAEWAALRGFYVDTTSRKGAHRYLTEGFFDTVRQELPHRVVGAFAHDAAGPVAGSLSFQKGQHLYGRYWGCTQSQRALHFELCYYAPIEACIREGWTRFEAGAQGEHKLKRGLMPSPTYSVHWIRHAGLAAAVARYLPEETEAVAREMDWLSEHGPFRRGDP